ncbi:MAG: hypothetical protein LBT47_06905 [Deltaproteobacteria bacterium]|nr:hypothetical protein [Deltaproteobacteria bacterium]
MKWVLPLIVLSISLLSACSFNRSEYDNMLTLRDEYLAQLSEIRQSNEIISRNIISAYQELEVLKNRLNERNTQSRTE